MSSARQFTMTFAELIDKLSIDQIKETKLPKDRAKNYVSCIKELEHDIDALIDEKRLTASAEFIRMVILLAQANLHVWNIKDRMTEEPDDYMEILTFAQELNGIRNHIKNLILEETGELTPATKRVTFLDYQGTKWYTPLLKSLKHND